ncbi:MAG: DUF4366 domain-containing protein [Clostridia bacterium]|nr:DUF4366 domain-containing protein [Clostridia bacterium]
MDDIVTADQQIITVQSRGGSYYYIIIDRTQEDGNVHFLNAVDERDLFAILKDEELLPVCICAMHCEETSYDESCPICAVNYESCTAGGQAVHRQESKGSVNASALILLVLLTICGGAGVWYYKTKKKETPKPTVLPYEKDDEEFPDLDSIDTEPMGESPQKNDSATDKPAENGEKDHTHGQEENETMFDNEEEEDGWHYEP